MKRLTSIAVIGLIMGVSACDMADIPGIAEKDKKTETDQAGLSLTEKIDKNGYFIGAERFDESKIPAELKDKVAVFQISLQSNDQPVLGGIIESFEPGDCTVTNIPWEDVTEGSDGSTRESISIGAPDTVSDPYTSSAEAGAAALTSDDPKSGYDCVTKRLEQFGPNKDSNFFSIVIQRSRVISLNVYANGYQSKLVTIDGSKAKFIVLNVELGEEIQDCRFEHAGHGGSVVEGSPGDQGTVDSSAPKSGSAVELPPVTNELPWSCGPISLPPVYLPPTDGPGAVCPELYAPVCALPPGPDCDGGTACPAVMPVETTYESECHMNAAKAKLIHAGECKK